MDRQYASKNVRNNAYPDSRRKFFSVMGLGSLVLATVNLIGGNAAATVVQAYDFDRTVDDAELIVEGTVSNIESRWSQDLTMIYTYVTLDQLELVHGESKSDTLTLRFEGGKVGAHEVTTHGVPKFEKGTRELLFVANNGVAVSPIVGFFQGRFKIVGDKVHDFAGLPIVGVRDGALLKLTQRPADTARDEDESGEFETGYGQYVEHPDNEKAEAELMAALAKREANSDARAIVEVLATGKSNGRDVSPDAAELTAPVVIAPGVAMQRLDKPTAIFLDASETDAEALSVDAFRALVRSRLNN